MARANTRQIILDAALDCFLAKGFATTSIADIKARSRTSTGSIYHFFESKEEIAQTLCVEALRSRAKATCNIVVHQSADLIVKAMVSELIQWAVENDRQHRFLMQCEFLAPSLSLRSELVDVLLESRLAQERVVRTLESSGVVRSMPADILRTLILGPAEMYLAEHAHGQTTTFPQEAIEQLGESAWRAICLDQNTHTQTKTPAKPGKRSAKWDLV